MRIVLLRLSALGDILRVLPAWANLREAWPNARFQAVVEDRHAFLLEPFPWLEPVVVHRKRLGLPWTALKEVRRVASCIQGADASLDFHGILKSAMIPRLAGIPERWGDGVTREGAAHLQTHPLPFRRQTRYGQALGLAEAFGSSRGVAGLGAFHPALKHAVLPMTPEVWPSNGKKRIVMVPGASQRGAIKRWPVHHWLELSRMLDDHYEPRWSLGPEEVDLRTWLPAATGISALPAMSLWELAAVLREADLVITPDTGLLHLAVLLGVPVLALFGSSDPLIAGLPEGAGRILRTGITCSPCRERRCQRRQCLEDLMPEDVAAAIRTDLP